MTVNGMRETLIKRYSMIIRGRRVDCMPDSQVIAIYRSLISRKDPELTRVRIAKKRRLHEPVKYEQLKMDLDELFEEVSSC